MTAEIKLLYLKILVKFFLYLSKSQAVVFLNSKHKSGLEEEYSSIYSEVQKSIRHDQHQCFNLLISPSGQIRSENMCGAKCRRFLRESY